MTWLQSAEGEKNIALSAGAKGGISGSRQKLAKYIQYMYTSSNIKRVKYFEIKTKWSNGFYIQFRQHFTKETFSYDEHLKS